MRLLLADSDPMILRCYRMFLANYKDIEVVGLIADSTDTIDICKAESPDVVLLDYRLDCVVTTRQIKAHCPNTQVIILALYGNTPEIQQAIHAGARGYIAKADGMERIIVNLRTIY